MLKSRAREEEEEDGGGCIYLNPYTYEDTNQIYEIVHMGWFLSTTPRVRFQGVDKMW